MYQQFTLNGLNENRVEKLKKFSHYISEGLEDDVDIAPVSSSQKWTAPRRFYRCSDKVKTPLFKAYHSIYTGTYLKDHSHQTVTRTDSLLFTVWMPTTCIPFGHN